MYPGTPDDFRVAIICGPLLKPLDVLQLFDQRYDKRSSGNGKQEGDMSNQRCDDSGSESRKQERDINIFSGRVGRHHVFLAHMPDRGAYSATKIASEIQLSFKKVRLALVVDICGNVSLECPIIPGDVIISDSIFELYTGRQDSDPIQSSCGLDNILEEQGSASGNLLVRQDLERGIKRHLTKLCKKTDIARYPGVEQDRRLAASYRHIHRTKTSPQKCLRASARPNDDSVCSAAMELSCGVLECGIGTPDNAPCRTCFASGLPTPLVHVGTASAATVLKAGEDIDITAIGAVDVWEDLRCVIIKGIYNDADAHKVNEWQGYAVATAASAAKALLDNWTEVPSRKRSLSLGDEDDARPFRRQRPLAEWQSIRSLTQKRSHRSGFSFSTSPSASVIPLAKLDFMQRDARHNTIKTAHVNTCAWLLSKEEYTAWQDEHNLHEHHGFLWIKGKPGAGKSTTMKFAYTNANKHTEGPIAISYFFNAGGGPLERSAPGMYRSLLFQLLDKVPNLQAVLETSEDDALQSTSSDSWTIETLKTNFRRAIQTLKDQHVICYIIALDECENNEDQVPKIVDFFKELGECAIKHKTRFLVCFSSRHSPHLAIDKSIQLTLEDQEGHLEDIARYVDSEFKVGPSKLFEQIKLDIRNISQGIFLWVVLIVSILQETYNRNPGQVRALGKRLKTIPKDLDGLFGNILGRDAQGKENLSHCLRWVLCAERPLSPKELYFAIISASETESLGVRDPKNVTSEDIERFILDSSRSLVEPTRSKVPTIQFIHTSVRDFLLRETGLAVLQMDSDCTSIGPVHDILKNSCQRYLDSIPADWKSTWIKFPFLDYAVHHI